MVKQITKMFAKVCVVILLTGAMCAAAYAADVEDSEAAAAAETEASPAVVAYTEISLFLNGDYVGEGMSIDSVTYVPLLAFCESILGEDCISSWDAETDTCVINNDSIEITLTVFDNYLVANGRCVYLPDGALNINGTVMLPIRDIATVFSLEIAWDEASWTVSIDSSDMEILVSGDEFYNEEDLYWLSRVISSEAGNQPLEGKIGVGNVVINRLNDDSGIFSGSIKGVIFQEGQFDVVESGAIYLEPNEESVVAAKLCLEGVNTVGDSQYFFNPDVSGGGWIAKNKTYAVTIGNHAFYA